ncbi:MAG: MBG domain-containing protein, partial [Opitutae bacterium]
VDLSGQVFDSQSREDVFLLKYNETGGFLWAARVPGFNAEDRLRATGVAVDAVGNAYVQGEFMGSIGFDGGTALASEFGTTDLFLARFTVNGSIDWVKQIGGYTEDYGGGITLDLDGQPVIAGTFEGSTKLDAAVTLYATASREMFVAKYDSTGELLWSRQVGGGSTSKIEPADLTTGPSGTIGVTGNFHSDLVFGDTTYASVGESDVFFITYDSHGELVHLDTFGSTGEDAGTAVIKDVGGATYIAGTFQQSMKLPGQESTPLLPQGDGDIFLAKVDATGEVLWARQSLGEGDNRLADLVVDSNRNAYLAGSFQQTLALGNKTADAAAPRAAYLAQVRRDIPLIPLQYEGFLEGEDVSVLDEPPVASVDATPEDDAGSEFPIYFTGGEDDNYAFEFTAGKFTVVKAAQAINFYQDFSNVQYNDVVPLTAVATSGLDISYNLVTGREIAFLPDASSLQVEGVGPIRLQAEQPGNKNYLPALPVTREILVPQAKQTITWEQDYEGKAYGDTFDLLAHTTSGLRITYTVKQGSASFDGNRVTLTSAGTLVLEATQSGTFIWEAAPPLEHVIEVAKAKLSVRPTDSVRMVGEEDPVFTLNYTGFKLQDNVSVLDEEPKAYTLTDSNTAAGSYDILIKDGSDDNYAYEFINAVMVVTEQQTQTLYFDQDFTGLTYGDSIDLIAFTDAGLPVEYAIEGGVGTLQG